MSEWKQTYYNNSLNSSEHMPYIKEVWVDKGDQGKCDGEFILPPPGGAAVHILGSLHKQHYSISTAQDQQQHNEVSQCTTSSQPPTTGKEENQWHFSYKFLIFSAYVNFKFFISRTSLLISYLILLNISKNFFYSLTHLSTHLFSSFSASRASSRDSLKPVLMEATLFCAASGFPMV